MSFRATRRALVYAMLAAIIMVSTAIVASAQTLPVTYKNSTYELQYDPERKILTCSSNNTDCVWRIEISRTVPSFNHFAAIATPAGPVIVYSEDDSNTYFALPHFRTGSLTVENSGEPLRGSIGRGWLLNCLFQQEQYGAKLVAQLVEPGSGLKLREYKWDINMWGTHACLERGELQDWTTGVTPMSTRVVSDDLKFKIDVPQGFRHTQLDETSVAMYGPTDDVFISVFSDAGATPIDELGDAYMAELGVSVEHRSTETLENGDPALLLMGHGTINEVPSVHVAVVYSNTQRTWVLAYTGRADVGEAYVPALMAALDSFEALQ